jgi:lipoyl(octanoyl) transferase
MRTEWLGRLDYQKALNIMDSVASGHLVIGLEHNPVITLGIRAAAEDSKTHLRSVSTSLPQVVNTDRGGLATLHNPGQLVIYPLLDLRALGLRPREYLSIIMRATLGALLKLDVKGTFRDDAPGIYVNNQKIAFFGIRIRQGRTRHGLSINVSNDLDDFRHLRPCGQDQQPMTSLEKLGVAVGLEAVFSIWCHQFQKELQKELQKDVLSPLTPTPELS